MMKIQYFLLVEQKFKLELLGIIFQQNCKKVLFLIPLKILHGSALRRNEKRDLFLSKMSAGTF